MIILAPAETITLTTDAGTVLVDVSYGDRSGAVFAEGNQRTSVTTTSTIVDAPNSGTRLVKSIYVKPSVTANLTLTVDGAALIAKSVDAGATVDLLLDASFVLLSISQVSGLQAALDGKQPLDDDLTGLASDYTASTKALVCNHCDAATSAGLHVGNAAHQDVAMFGAGGSQGTTLYGQLNCLAIDSTHASGIVTRAASTQDAIALVGRAGGTSSYVGTLTPTTLTASRTYTFPDAAITVAGINLAQTWTSAQSFTTGTTTISTADINGGTIDGAVIGGASAAAATFTTLTTTSTTTVPNGTAAAPGIRLTSEASGLYRIGSTSVGVSVAGALVLTVGSTASSFASGTTLTVANSTAATSTSTGALVVTGGAGVGGALYVGSGLAVTGGGSFTTTFSAGGTITGSNTSSSQHAVQGLGTTTLAAGVTDGFTSSIGSSPTYSGAFTVTRHNYINLINPTLAGGAALTDACAIRFDANAGTHKAVASGTTKTSPGTVSAWVKININGTIHYIPAYTSTTS